MTQLSKLPVSYALWDGSTKLFHGSRSDLQIGDVILPASVGKLERNWGRVHNGKSAHATANIDTAKYYAYASKGSDCQYVYEVQPVDKKETLASRDLQLDKSESPSVEYRSQIGFVIVAKHIVIRNGSEWSLWGVSEAAQPSSGRRVESKRGTRQHNSSGVRR